MTPWLVAASAACGVVLLLGAPAGSGIRARSRATVVFAIVLGAGFAAVAWGEVRPHRLALGLIALGAGFPAMAMIRQRLRTRRAHAVAGKVVDAVEAIAAELAVGLPPRGALLNAAEDWPALRPVAAAEELGADVPLAWRDLALIPGGQELRFVAGAWSAAHQSGGSLADAMTRVAARLRAGQATERLVAAELASARATARLVAGLPVLALMMGTTSDSKPVEFLLTEPLGLACLAGGVGFGLIGLWWIEAIASGVHR